MQIHLSPKAAITSASVFDLQEADGSPESLNDELC